MGKDSLINDGTHDIDGGIDQIITDFGFQEDGGELDGWPSDHPMIKGKFAIGEKSEKLRKNVAKIAQGAPGAPQAVGAVTLRRTSLTTRVVLLILLLRLLLVLHQVRQHPLRHCSLDAI